MAGRSEGEGMSDLWRTLFTEELARVVKAAVPLSTVAGSARLLYVAFLRAQCELLKGLAHAAEVQLKELEKPPAARAAPRGATRSRKRARRIRVQ